MATKRPRRFGNDTTGTDVPTIEEEAGPSGVGDPVELQSNLAPWQHPQHLPGTPHRLPAPGARLGYPPNTLIAGSPTGVPGGSPGPMPVPVPARSAIMDPHHYARIISGLTPNASMISTAAVALNTPVITSPGGYRNLLMVRNMAGTGGGNLYVDFGQAATSNSVIKLTPGQMILFDEVVPQDDIYLFSDATAAANSAAWMYSNIAAS